MDFMQPEKRGWSAQKTVWVGRGFIVMFMLLAATISPLIEHFSGLFHYLQSALAYLVSPVVVVFIFGLFWRRATATGALLTLAGGHAVSAVFFVLSLRDILTLHFTIVAGILALISALIFVVVSFVTASPGEQQVKDFTFHRATTARQTELGWWQDYRLYSLILVLLATALVIAHW
jgi:SSS family solute:Na+ symporter